MSKYIKYDWASGTMFGKVTTTGKSFIYEKNRKVEIICDCGNIGWMNWQNMKSGQTVSCGCFKKNHIGEQSKTHGMSDHILHNMWLAMKGRCYNKKNKRFPLYGAIGVKVCKEWLDSFINFYEWAISNGWRKGLEIDKDKLAPTKPGKLYSPEFCCFLTHKENCNYTGRTRYIEYNGETKSLTQWCEILSLERRDTHRRIFKYGWSIDDVVNYNKA